MTIYRRNAACTKGHAVAVSFEWDAQRTTEDPMEFSGPCPVAACDGRVAMKLPIGTDPTSVKLIVQ